MNCAMFRPLLIFGYHQIKLTDGQRWSIQLRSFCALSHVDLKERGCYTSDLVSNNNADALLHRELAALQVPGRVCGRNRKPSCKHYLRCADRPLNCNAYFSKVGVDGVNLPNLKFKSEALRDLNLPITVKEGLLGNLHIAIPWSEIFSKHTITVVLEDVFLLVVPKSNTFDYAFEKRAQATKERFLQLREMMVTSAEDLEKQKLTETELAGSTWTERLVSALINNIEVSINRIHVRYEDEHFCAGLTVDSLGALSCDEVTTTCE
jgi:hypothetical protein